jgi:ubiquinone/menaquinone biosynthesis C-methylase UbiE
MTTAAQEFSDGAAYERQMGRWSRKIGVQFLDWCGVAPGQKWLDVGCGNGAFTQEIIAGARPSQVLGVDPSPGQIEFARSRFGVSAATFEVGDAMKLPVADGNFDFAAMALAISFVPNPAEAVVEMKRTVRKGGMVATYMWDFAGGGLPLKPFVEMLKALGVEMKMPPHPEAAGRDALQTMWRAAGLSEIETTVLHTEIAFRDFDDFWDSCSASGPPSVSLAAFTAAQRAELKERSRAIFRTAADGSIAYQSFANAVKGLV